ncbi:MAG TPA: hypothetical protein VN876_05800 [Gemmatimonadaceae bacterium]|nr:hypothetical protein [Gemmatimonadaceae bacterium]
MGNHARLSLLAAVLALAFSTPASFAQPQLLKTSARDAQLPTDSAEISQRAHDLQARFERRRRQMLPRFYIGSADRCLIVGRFCEWHPNLNGYVVPDEGKDIVRARAELLRDLEKASTALPGDDWIIGQRIRYLTEGHDASAADVARSCRATRWWCDALLGLALHIAGDYAGADSAYAVALDGMPSQTRCHWLNLSPLLDDDIRDTYKKMSCAQREAVDARIWWVADPLYMIPGNERRTEHFSRVLHTTLQRDAENTYGSSWGGDLAELILRFGWAEKWTKEPPNSSYPESKAPITGHEREPGYHFFLTQRPPDSLALIVDSVFDIYQSPPREQYAPVYTRAFVRLDAQVARFRRGDSTKVVASYDVSADTIFGRRRFTAALIAMGDEATSPSQTRVADAPARNVLTVSTPWKEQLIGVELLANDSAGAARWRSGFAEIPLDSGRISVSDLLFVDGEPSLPGDLNEAIPRAHGGTKFRRDRKVGLFWELYGKTPADSALPISLTITPVDEGLLRRAFRALHIAPKVSPLNIRWHENGASGVLSARSVLLDLSLVPAGKYAVKLEVGNNPTAATSRVIEVK